MFCYIVDWVFTIHVTVNEVHIIRVFGPTIYAVPYFSGTHNLNRCECGVRQIICAVVM